MYHKILIALKGKETDTAVVAHVETLALQMRADVILLQVITVANDEAGGLGIQFQTEVGSSGWRRINRAKQRLPQLERRLREAGLSVETALVIGTRSEADEIVGFAARSGCDLISMASDARPWYRRWIGGCPADGVLRKALVPVLFVGDGTRTAPAERTPPEAHKMMEIFGSASL
jgi:nucleotide-binding universal stress UspA family protein